MPITLPHRVAAATAVGMLTVALISGCTATPVVAPSAPAAAPSVDAIAGVSTAELASAAKIRCAGDAATRSAASTGVAYRSLPGTTFAAKQRAAGDRIVRVGHQTIALRNFTPAHGTIDGGVLSAGGLVGQGATRTTIRLVPHSSTHKRDVPHVSTRTNQLSVLRVTGNARVLRGFLLEATSQGHLYNGLRIDRVQHLRASHIKVVGIPGNDHQQPGETFGINDYKTVDARWSHIVVDGLGVGGSGFGVNGSKDITICGSTSRNNPSAMGFAFWQTRNIRLVDDTATHNGFSGFNFERVSGTVTMIRPAASGNGYNMRIASDRSSAKFRIVDPKLVNGVWTIWMPRTWYVRNKQKRGDVTLIVHGTVRNDLLRFRTY